jgi:hypothetical protein
MASSAGPNRLDRLNRRLEDALPLPAIADAILPNLTEKEVLDFSEDSVFLDQEVAKYDYFINPYYVVYSLEHTPKSGLQSYLTRKRYNLYTNELIDQQQFIPNQFVYTNHYDDSSIRHLFLDGERDFFENWIREASHGVVTDHQVFIEPLDTDLKEQLNIPSYQQHYGLARGGFIKKYNHRIGRMK